MIVKKEEDDRVLDMDEIALKSFPTFFDEGDIKRESNEDDEVRFLPSCRNKRDRYKSMTSHNDSIKMAVKSFPSEQKKGKMQSQRSMEN